MLVYQRVFSTAQPGLVHYVVLQWCHCTWCTQTLRCLFLQNKDQEIVMQRGTLSSKVSICFLCIFTLAIYRTPGWTCNMSISRENSCKTTEQAPAKTAAGSFTANFLALRSLQRWWRSPGTWTHFQSCPKCPSLSHWVKGGKFPFPFQRGARSLESKKLGI